MDYKDLFTSTDHEEGAEVQLIDMAGKLVDMYLTIQGVDSKAWRNAKYEMERKAQLNAYLAEEKQLNVDPDEAVSEAFSRCVLGWRGFTNDGEEVEFSKDSVKELFLNAPYIRDHVDKFFSNRSNFIKGKASE